MLVQLSSVPAASIYTSFDNSALRARMSSGYACCVHGRLSYKPIPPYCPALRCGKSGSGCAMVGV